MYGRYRTASFYCQREQKMHMWLPFCLLKIQIYKRMMMMIFMEHLVLGTYARSFVLANYFFLQCFISVLYKERNILKARFTFHFHIFIIIRVTSHPIPRPSISGRNRVLSPPVTTAGLGKRPVPGFSFIKSKKKKQMNLVKDFTFLLWTKKDKWSCYFQSRST